MRSISMGLWMTVALSPSTPTDEDSHRPTAPQLCAGCHNVLSTDFGLALANSEGTENEDRVQGDTVVSNSTENEGSNNPKTVTRPPTAERTHISTILTVRLFFLPFYCSRSPYMPVYSDLIYTRHCPTLIRVPCPFTTTFLSRILAL